MTVNPDLSHLKVQDIGEQGLLKILQGFCPPEIIGDDGAILAIVPTESLVVTTDVLVDNIHFSNITTSAADAGWRAVAANLSDLAAMGAKPVGITVGLGLPGDTCVEWVRQLYQGMGECLNQYGTVIVGGDIVRSPVKTISITAFGQVHPSRAIRRHTAKVGDVILVTGFHGASRGGLELLLHPESSQNLTLQEKQYLITAHQRPQPRLDILTLLESLHPNSSHQLPLPIAGMDSSDGLADAVLQICRASGVGAVIQQHLLPIPPTFFHWLSPTQAREYTLYGGEDFELVLCLPAELAQKLVSQIGQGAVIIGNITESSTVMLRDIHKKNPDQILNLSQGFQHFNQ
ncbi:thiamine-phosphate kinase [Calothrix sp. 336/3]|uniref:thiamine-phosphate kinase n=1 Tax=Calothrix sp. 336/3 TaxID=1337936 RepID=UPI0004E38D48|nr:thiamine-phosphate kinase [Calothrix sp. 336/3]AKG23898.1 thiamine monophosphate kinase [Calothrix sp. 336/3]